MARAVCSIRPVFRHESTPSPVSSVSPNPAAVHRSVRSRQSRPLKLLIKKAAWLPEKRDFQQILRDEGRYVLTCYVHSMGKHKLAPSLTETCNGFLLRVQDLGETGLHRVGAWCLSGDADPNAGNLPSRDQLIAYLTFFRQFFLHSKEPVSVTAIAGSLREAIKDPELLDALAFIEKCDPFGLEMKLETGGREFDLRQLAEAFVSKYFHSDRIPPELADDGYSWQAQIFPLSLAFARGMNIVLTLRAVILEASRRGLIDVSIKSPPEQRKTMDITA